jgi:hypothetical protein
MATRRKSCRVVRRRNPARSTSGKLYRLSDGTIMTAAQYKRIWPGGKCPSPAARRLLGITAVSGKRRNPRARPNENDIPTVIIKRAKRNPNARKRKVAARRYFQHKHDMACKVSHNAALSKRRSSFERITAGTRAYFPLSRVRGEFVKRGKDKHLIDAYGMYLETKQLPKRGKYQQRKKRRNPEFGAPSGAFWSKF